MHAESRKLLASVSNFLQERDSQTRWNMKLGVTGLYEVTYSQSLVDIKDIMGVKIWD